MFIADVYEGRMCVRDRMENELELAGPPLQT